MSATTLPRQLTRSDLYFSAPQMATDWWGEGFRPVHAFKLKAGMKVRYWATDVFQLATEGAAMTSEIFNVTDDEMGTVTVHHGGGATETDECTEVWAS